MHYAIEPERFIILLILSANMSLSQIYLHRVYAADMVRLNAIK